MYLYVQVVGPINFFFISSPYAAICPRTFSSSDDGDDNGMQGIHPTTYLL